MMPESLEACAAPADWRAGKLHSTFDHSPNTQAALLIGTVERYRRPDFAGRDSKLPAV